MDPATIITGVSLLWSIFQTVKKKQYSQALDHVIEGVELAKNYGTNPKQEIAEQVAGTGSQAVLNNALRKKGYLRKRAIEDRTAQMALGIDETKTRKPWTPE